jgi:predicted ArsR family transcriptional regulator
MMYAFDRSQEVAEVRQKILCAVAKSEGMTPVEIARWVRAPPRLVERQVRVLAERGAVRVQEGRNTCRVYVARMSDTAVDLFDQIRALASRGAAAARDTAPVVEQ